jgi:hypothetical protein
VSTPAIVEALRTLTTEIMRSEEFQTALRDVMSKVLAGPRPEAVEMVPPSVFAREHSMNPATVRKLCKEGRVEATKIGPRQWRVRRDSPIGQPMARGATSADTPAERARRLVEQLK